jgi:hypothetical protein
MSESTIRARLGWEITPERDRQIRASRIAHSKAEDTGDLDGLIWDPQHETFAGERIHFDRAALSAALGGG